MDASKSEAQGSSKSSGHGNRRNRSRGSQLEVALPVDVGNILSFTGGAVVGVALLFAVRKIYR